MANIEVHPPVHGGVETEREVRIVSKRRPSIGGVAVETLAAVGAVVLSIIGLAGLFPIELSAISAIAASAALLLEGVTLAARLRQQTEHSPKTIFGGLSIESLAGLGGITLGILSLLSVSSPFVLLPVAAIVVGGGLMFAARPLAHEVAHVSAQTTERWEGDAARGAAWTASGAYALAGVGAVVLGIIGLTMPALVTLPLVAFLVAGGTLILGSATVGGRIASAWSH